MEFGGDVKLGNESLVFLKRWKDSLTHEAAFVKLSDECAELLGIQSDLENRDFKTLVEIDYFHLIDLKILSELATAILNKTMTAGECIQLIRSRRRGHWYREFSHIYDAVEYAAQLIELLDTLTINLESPEHGISTYVESFYQVDQIYRKFIYHTRHAGQATFFQELTSQICGRYTNSFLLPLGDRWQEQVDGLTEWNFPETRSQSSFFNWYVKPILDKNKKVFVIISDAMRFEIGEELCRRIRREDKYEARLDPIIAKLPSYTQLGMAALLPNKSLRINEDKTPTVRVDDKSSSGTVNRNKILNAALDGSALAIKFEDFITKNREDARELIRDHNVIYLYQNRIDDTGHSRETERQAFDAAEETMEELIKLVKKVSNAYTTNIIITADHGFVYQDEVSESDFSMAEIEGDAIVSTDRRFVVGHNLKATGGINRYDAKSLGLDGDLEVVIPKSINRFRKSGSGTRFMHGGSTLQEIVLPVIQINKSRKPDVSTVDVDFLPTSTSIISTGQLAVALYQTEPVTEKVQPRILRVSLYASDGKLISDQHELPFDLSSENPRERELKIRMVLSKEADAYNQQQVYLKLEEKVSETSHYQEYKAVSYTLRRSFTSDFE